MVSFSAHSSSTSQGLSFKEEKKFSEVKTISNKWTQHECCPLLKRKTEEFTECLSRCQEEKGAKLQKNIKVLEKHSKEIKKLESYRGLWEKFFPDSDPETFYKYGEEIEFLFRTRLIYSIKGQQTASRDPDLIKPHQIQFLGSDVKIRMNSGDNGESGWISVRELMNPDQFRYDAERMCLVDSQDRSWNYFKDGLQQIDRWEGSEFIPVAKISRDEKEAILTHAKTFWEQPASSLYETSRVQKSTDEDSCVVQIFMCPRGVLENPWVAGAHVHSGIRLIDDEGNVYSSGFGSTIEEDKFNEGATNLLTTINGMPTLMDYEETRADDGRVTLSLSVTPSELDNIVQTLKEYRQNTIRFNLLRQNCTKLAAHVLHHAGVDVNNRGNFYGQQIDQLLPNKIHSKIHKASKAYKENVPAGVRQGVGAASGLLTFPGKLVYLAGARALTYALGAHKGSPMESTEHMDKGRATNPAEKMENFHHASALSGIFDDPIEAYNSTLLMRWLLAQPSTTLVEYKKTPDMRIHPDQHSPEKLDRLRKIYHVHKYELAQEDQQVKERKVTVDSTDSDRI